MSKSNCKLSFLIISVIANLFYSVAAENKVVAKAELKSVTVYKNGAELMHNTRANLPKGNTELVIENVANAVDYNSIQIKTASSVTLMGIEFSNNYMQQGEKSATVRNLEDSLEKLQGTWNKLNNGIVNNDELMQVLRTNRDLKGTQTGMNVAELSKLMEYYKTKMEELQASRTVLVDKTARVNEQMIKLKNQINEENSKNVTSAGRIILQLSVALSGNYDFTVSYVTPNANWNTYYDVRLDDIKSPLKILTKAKITQTSGIDWKQVKLSLSTSTPGQWGSAPLLNAWYLTYINPDLGYGNQLRKQNTIQSMNVLEGKVAGLNVEKPEENAIKLRGDKTLNNDNKPIYIVNGNRISSEEMAAISPNSIKKIDVLKGEAATSMYGADATDGAIIITLKDGLDEYVSVADNTLNFVYDIELPYDVPTNGKEQTATISNTEIAATYKHYAVPKLDKEAYLLAEIAEWNKLNLQPGEANIIFEGTYVGKTFIDPASTTDTLNLTLGRDKRVVVKREKMIDFSSVKFLGTNKLQKFSYQITVRNTKNEPVKILLKDQYPLTTNKEIEVELLETDGAEVNNDNGVLNWKLNLSPNETRKLKFSYSVKYPKDKQLNLN